MIFGQYLRSDDEGGALSYYTPWFQREGNWAQIVADIIHISSDCDVTIVVETKTTEQSDKSATTNTSWSGGPYTATGQWTFAAGASMEVSGSEGFFELIRFKFTVQATDPVQSAQWTYLRMLNPSWQTN